MRKQMIGLKSRRMLAATVAAIAPAWMGDVCQAQSVSPPPAGVQCLTRTFLDASGAAQPLTIFVPAGEAGTYAAQGFVASACGAQSLAAYSFEACRVSHLGNTAVQDRLTAVLGVRPADLCASAERASQLQTTTAG